MPEQQSLSEDQWSHLLEMIDQGKLVPFLGAGVNDKVLPDGKELARCLANECSYPFEKCENLQEVAQFMTWKYEPADAKGRVLKALKPASAPNFETTLKALRVMARLPIPIYVTTNYDSLLSDAIKAFGRVPTTDYCRWNEGIEARRSAEAATITPSPEQPLVFHIHGSKTKAESLVITEDDYVAFIGELRDDVRMMPPQIQRAFVDKVILFMGYSFHDVNIKLMMLSNSQVISDRCYMWKRTPSGAEVVPTREDDAKTYLQNYFKKMKITVIWDDHMGDPDHADSILTELEVRWGNYVKSR